MQVAWASTHLLTLFILVFGKNKSKQQKQKQTHTHTHILYGSLFFHTLPGPVIGERKKTIYPPRPDPKFSVNVHLLFQIDTQQSTVPDSLSVWQPCIKIDNGLHLANRSDLRHLTQDYSSLVPLSTELLPKHLKFEHNDEICFRARIEMGKDAPVTLDSKNVGGTLGQYDTVLLDCDGVLWGSNHVSPLPGEFALLILLRWLIDSSIQ